MANVHSRMNAPHHLSASTLTVDPVKNHQGEDLGNLKDLMIDTTEGKIAYAVLGFGGVLGMGEKLFAVPWEALTIDADNKQLLLNASKDHLKDAPGFDKDRWPTFADKELTARLSDFYARH